MGRAIGRVDRVVIQLFCRGESLPVVGLGDQIHVHRPVEGHLVECCVGVDRELVLVIVVEP